MSKTDKDVPGWVRKMRPEEQAWANHWCYRTGRDCDLGEVDAPHAGRVRCQWVLPWYGSWWNPPREVRRSMYWKPERSRSKMALDRLAKTWTGDAEEMDDSGVRLEQHRHSPYVGGYWD